MSRRRARSKVPARGCDWPPGNKESAMRLRLKPLKRQVIVLTGATSGHGLAFARMAAERGARLMLAARNEGALRNLADELNRRGARAGYRVTDVGRKEEMDALAAAAIETFGGFDTWVNDAGVSIYGTLENIPVEDHRRLFETNYWGVVYGSLAAARHLRARGGAIVNMGSILGERSVPLQGPYCAAKHAVKGFTDALRMELMHDRAPVSVTLILPAGIDTPLIWHARNYMTGKPNVPPPPYSPKIVARALLYACQHPTRQIAPGGAGLLQIRAAKLAPGLSDRVMARVMYWLEQSYAPRPAHGPDNLYGPGEDLHESSGLKRVVLPVAPITESRMHPVLALGVFFALGAATLMLKQVARTGK
jgi:NAD(P)-dependent dehydrogenase (short-subunit alcohol dehydrogenase family)